MDVWVYSGKDWFVRDPKAPHVAREQWTVKFAADRREDFDVSLDSAVKIVGVSDDHDLVARCEKEAQDALGARPRRPARSPTISTSPIRTPTRATSSPTLSKLLSVPAARSPRSATCPTTC